jgi:hypothetical protein
MKSLSNEKREELLQLAELWNEEGPPRDIQIRYVYQGKSDKYFIDSWTIIEMQQRMQVPNCKNLLEVDRDMGMKVMVMAAWIGKDQELKYAT